jgi:hypothetical protein
MIHFVLNVTEYVMEACSGGLVEVTILDIKQ